MHASLTARRTAVTWLAALMGSLALLLATPALSHAEDNANNYACLGHVKAGQPEAGNEEQQVQYSFYCDGAITGYQLQSQIPVTGIAASPLVTLNTTGAALTDTFSCSGEFPGYALNCVGLAKQGWETVTGQFSIGKKLCAEPRVDPLLTVTYAYIEKGAVVQAISGPFDLGRPLGCKADALSGSTRLNPHPPVNSHKKKTKKSAKKSAHKTSRH